MINLTLITHFDSKINKINTESRDNSDSSNGPTQIIIFLHENKS